uniref:molybdopterin-dependent oxidoreductase n=1 Tax=Nocardiopsis lucentensis TaxID=53441 RepID=UPI0003704791
MDLEVNGSPAPASDTPGATAAEHIRDRLGLTGTKIACGDGVCGACTVLLDGSPTVSCLLPADALPGRSVTTVEGLGGTHPVQRAFAAHDGLQCGYCTPGFVVEAATFTDAWRAEHGDVRPDRDTVADALSGHLCRCGAYEGIFSAVAAACAGEFDTEPEQDPPRADALDKVTGRARFTVDRTPPGCWESVFVRSTLPHARIRSVDPAGARTESGTGPDTAPVLVDLLGEERVVRYAGQPIAVVAAPTGAEARAAAEAVRVDYDPLPAVLTREAALAPGAPMLYPTKEEQKAAPAYAEGVAMPASWRGNLRGPFTLGWRRGTALKRLRAAGRANDPRLVAEEYTTSAQLHTSLEPHACVADWAADGHLTMYMSTQAVSEIATAVAERWGLPRDRVRVITEYVGGGFGAKASLSTDIVASVELSRLAQAPVRVAFTRAEELTDAGYRPGTRTRVALLADDKGDLAAMSVDSYGDGGVSYGSMTAMLAALMYGRTPRRTRDYDVVTNHPPGSPFRGPGGPPMAFALEQAG